MLFWSLIEPPGWITAVTPASAASSTQSGKGKKASEAMLEPFRSNPKPCAFSTACFRASTRLVWPVPLASSWPFFGKDHGVGLGVLDELEGKQQVGLALWALDVRRARPLVGRFHGVVAFLNEVAVQGGPNRGLRKGAWLLFEQDAVLLLGEHVEGFRVEPWRDDHFTEQGVDQVGGLQVDGAVGDQDPSEGACGVARQSVRVGLRQGLTRRASTRIVVLQDRECGSVVVEILP